MAYKKEFDKFKNDMHKYLEEKIKGYFEDVQPTMDFTNSVIKALDELIDDAYKEMEDENLDQMLYYLLDQIYEDERLIEDVNYPDHDNALLMLGKAYETNRKYYEEITKECDYSMSPEDCIRAEFEYSIWKDIDNFLDEYDVD